MAEETRKRVAIEYTVEDHAAGALGHIAKKGHEAGHAVEHVKEKVREFRTESLAMAAGALGVGFGLGAIIEKAKEANVEFGGAQKAIASTMATILQWPRATSAVDRFTGSMRLARDVTRELDETAAAYGMQLPDVAAAYRTIGVSAAPLHLSQKQWMDLAVKSAAAAKQFGISGEEAANTIGKALVSRSIRATSDLGKFLYTEVGGNLHKLNNAQILAKMDKALGQSTEIAKKMGEGFGGSIARIQNRVDDLFRDVTGPLFKEVGGALDGFASKLQSLGEDGKPLIETYANKLVSAFDALKTATGFLLDHWKQIAAVWAGMKIAGGISGLASGGAAGLGGKLAGLAKGSGIPLAGAALGLAIESGMSRSSQHAGDFEGVGGLRGALGAVSEIARLRDQMRELSNAPGYAQSPQGAREVADINKRVMEQMEGAAGALRAAGIEATDDYREKSSKMAAGAVNLSDKELHDAVGLSREGFSRMNDLLTQIVYKKGILDWAGGGAESDPTKLLKTTGKPQINLTGPNHWEMKFEDADPDRVMLRFQEGIENNVLRRTASPLSEALAD